MHTCMYISMHVCVYIYICIKVKGVNQFCFPSFTLQISKTAVFCQRAPNVTRIGRHQNRGLLLRFCFAFGQEETSGTIPKKVTDFLEIIGAIFGSFWASPGPGVAGIGFPDLSLLKRADFQPNPRSGDPFRGDFPFRKAAPIPKTVL